MARLSEPRFASSGGKFVPIKFRLDTLPLSDSEKLFKKAGSQFPAFSIEPLPFERDRVGEPMSAEDRARRKQWMKDQELPKGEPRMDIVEKIRPKNAIRKFYQYPGDMLEGLLSKSMSPYLAKNLRLLTTRAVRAYVIGLGIVYWVKYNGKTWEKKKGPIIYTRCADTFWKDIRNQESKEFADFGFNERKVLRQ